MTTPTHLVFDIETAPRLDPWVVEYAHEKVSPPKNYTKPDTIAKWWENEGAAAKAGAVAKCALSGTTGQVVAIGWAWMAAGHAMAGPTVITQSPHMGEAELLDKFFVCVRAMRQGQNGRQARPTWTGYNITGFDICFLYQRAVALGVEMGVGLPVGAKPWSDSVLDLMHAWCGNAKGAMVKKEVCAKALGIDVPETAISGAEVPQLWAQGRHDQIAEHCRQDVDMEVEIFRRIIGARP